MRWVARIFANAIARRVAALLVAAALAWVGVGSAAAANCKLQSDHCDQGEAYSQALAHVSTLLENESRERCILQNGTSTFGVYSAGTVSPGRCSGTPTWHNGTNASFRYDQSCSSRPDQTTSGSLQWAGTMGSGARDGSIQCNQGCETGYLRNSDGTWNATTSISGQVCSDIGGEAMCDKFAASGYYWNAYQQACELPQVDCDAGEEPDGAGGCQKQSCPAGMVLSSQGTCDSEKNECPAGNVKAPSGECLPGDGQCAQGEARGKDGTCKRDADGDGQPDDGENEGDTDETFAGGDNCNAPPSCSGSPILCGQARIQWRIDCNTRKNRNITGGTCNAIPICTGENCDAVEYTQLLMQWRTACALEKLSIGGGNGGDGSGEDVAAIRNALTGDGGSPDIGAEGNPADSWASSGGNGSAIEPDTSGYGWGGGSCPSPPAITVLGAVIQFDATPVCNWLGLGSYFVLGLAALASLRIVASKEA
ncbi:virulence factor TspB C-terminal domain-related protein [Stenotrophomonas sp. NLF4-10]|uniref:virulence factor TspB C-terminal domain-related protein n=1 Tax=Stenotrophomonas sp. NLF4-10 TaxID=2918754 RepID=UPI001EFBCB33|nr:virulence factor TspB C-terminal domain-related protein [Stenotrophomonas sp. NLF4-10]MCG8276629.1 hypothetical protein [Stenotrophomonas sp. NLF4-10]